MSKARKIQTLPVKQTKTQTHREVDVILYESPGAPPEGM